LSSPGLSPEPFPSSDARRHPATPEVQPADSVERQVRESVSMRPLRSLWDLQGVPPKTLLKRVWNALFNNDLFGAAAELGYWFLFALFPTLVSVTTIIGLFARSRWDNYDDLLHYLSLMVPPSAYGIVLDTFNQITARSTGRKLTFGLALALWAASAGFSAMQDSMNAVYQIKESRPYWRARGAAVLISTLLSLLITAILGALLAGDFFGHFFAAQIYHHPVQDVVVIAFRIAGWTVATALLMLLFAMIYYWAPDLKTRRWRWLTPGAAIGILGWALASVGLRVYLHYFNTYSATYGSLGAVIILLTWFYLSGLMLLIGAQVNSEIEAAVSGRKLKEAAQAHPEADLRPAA
jgi:membrane protein